jgi:hypothetical protein
MCLHEISLFDILEEATNGTASIWTCLFGPSKGQTQCIEAPTQGGVWGGII